MARPVDGLRRDAKSGRFYPTGKGSPSFGTDETLAIARLRRWKADQEDEPGTIPFYHPSISDALAAQLEEWHAAELIESDDPEADAGPARTPEELLADGEYKADPEPGPMAIWRGWKRLNDLTEGYNAYLTLCICG